MRPRVEELSGRAVFEAKGCVLQYYQLNYLHIRGSGQDVMDLCSLFVNQPFHVLSFSSVSH